MEGYLMSVNKDLIILLLTILTVILGFFAIRPEIRTIISSIGFAPFTHHLSKINSPFRAIIRKPNLKITFNNQNELENVFHSPDDYTIIFTSMVNLPIIIEPEILVQVIRVSEIDDLPTILFYEPREHGAGGGGGGDSYDKFLVKLDPKEKVFIANQSSSNHELFNLPIDKPQCFYLEVEYSPGYYYWYKIGINYSIGSKKYTHWLRKVNFGGDPKVMRRWYFREELNNDYTLIKSEKLFIENYQYFESENNLHDSTSYTSEEYQERFSYGK